MGPAARRAATVSLALDEGGHYNLRLALGLRKAKQAVVTQGDPPSRCRHPVPGPSMRFVLVDRIISQETGQSLVAVKNLSLAEEYLADHFPGFPVMPGVLMLEALTQAGAWLVRDDGRLRPQRDPAEVGQDDQVWQFRRARPPVAVEGHDGLARRARGELQGGGHDRRPDHGQGPIHAHPLQSSRAATRNCTRPTPRSSPGSGTSTPRSARARWGPGRSSGTSHPPGPTRP